MGKVVHIDHNAFFRKMMHIFLSELGYEYEGYEQAQDAINAINALQDKSIDCVITGLNLPDIKWEELIKKIKISSKPTSIVAVIDAIEEKRIKSLEAMGVLSVIDKSGNWKEELRKILR